MGVDWFEADEDVIELAQDVIERYHPELQTARIGFIMRSEAPRTSGRATLGEARKVSDREKVHIPFDFIVWLADDTYRLLSGSQRVALIDHELEHCGWDPQMRFAFIRHHDLEEFSAILERHGYWWPRAFEVGEIAKQAQLWEMDEKGGASAVTVEAFLKQAEEA